MAKPTVAPSEPTVVAPPVHVPHLPSGVQMHQAGVSPYATKKPAIAERDPKGPPPGWCGGYARCGWCGDFLGDASRCPTCSSDEQPSNVQMSTAPKMTASK